MPALGMLVSNGSVSNPGVALFRAIALCFEVASVSKEDLLRTANLQSSISTIRIAKIL
jgi:hypothetical protein